MMTMMEKIFLEKQMEISALYARCLETSNRINWTLENETENGQVFDSSDKFLSHKQ